MAARFSQTEIRKIEKLWLNGLVDREIAQELRCNTKRIANFRTNREMPSNFGLFSWKEELAGVGN